jgi:STAS-like domain of unknown function (DUF4325)
MIIELKKFGTTLISRQTGKEAFAAFQSSLKNISGQEDVTVDFEGVITFTPSWGDEFLTPLFKNYGERFKLMHTKNPSVQTTLEILEKSNNIKFNIEK